MKVCKGCGKEKYLPEFGNQKTGHLGKKSKCKECTKKYNDSWYSKNRDYTVNYMSEKRRTDIGFKILSNLSSRTSHLIPKGVKRGGTVKAMLGCSIDKLKEHLVKTAIKNGYEEFKIEDYGVDYSIDHIKPCVKFNLYDSDEQKACFHYTNLQILSAIDNSIKHDSDVPNILEIRKGKKSVKKSIDFD